MKYYCESGHLLLDTANQVCAKCAEASAAPPSEREAAERIADEIAYSTANRELSPEQFKTFIMGIILHEFTMTKQACGHRTKHCCSKCKTCFACCQCEARAAVPQAAVSSLEIAREIERECVEYERGLDIDEAAAIIEKYRAAAVPAPATEWENRYRQLLWESHAGYTHRSYLYGDDGEMQCNHHDCLLDFKRAAIEEIDKHLWEMNLKRAAKQQAVAGATAPPKEGK